MYRKKATRLFEIKLGKMSVSQELEILEMSLIDQPQDLVRIQMFHSL